MIHSLKTLMRRRLNWLWVDHRPSVPSREHHPCPYCGGPMLRLEKTEEQVVRWVRCGSCERHQEGVMAA